MNNPVRMDGDWTTQPEISLDRGLTLRVRVTIAVAALLVAGPFLALLIIHPTHIFGKPVAYPTDTFGAVVFVALVGAAVILWSAFASNVRWTIGPNEIRIAQQRIFGPLHTEVVGRPDIRDVTIYWEYCEEGRRIWLLLDRLSGPSIESPGAPPGIEPELLKDEIATRLLITPQIKHI